MQFIKAICNSWKFISQFSHLKSLDIQECNINRDHLRSISNMDSLQSLTINFDQSNYHINEADLSTTIPNMKNLVKLKLETAPLDDSFYSNAVNNWKSIVACATNNNYM